MIENKSKNESYGKAKNIFFIYFLSLCITMEL